jgi:CubicO group peptidase (beta-lactamase class C family)
MPIRAGNAVLTSGETWFRPAVFALCLLVGLGSAAAVAAAGSVGETETTYDYSPPEQLDDGWKVSTLEAEGIDTETIELLTGRIHNNKYKHIYSMAIVKNGALVHEAYFNGRDRDSRIKIHSITKSVTSMLIGIAIANGKIGGLDETVMTYLPDCEKYVDDPRKNAITLEHILTLKTGWKWDEKSAIYDDPTNSHYWMEESDDWLQYVIEQPIENEPGERFVYNTGAVHLCSPVSSKTRPGCTRIVMRKRSSSNRSGSRSTNGSRMLTGIHVPAGRTAVFASTRGISQRSGSW